MKSLIASQTSSLHQRFRFTPFWEGQRVKISKAAYEACKLSHLQENVRLLILQLPERPGDPQEIVADEIGDEFDLLVEGKVFVRHTHYSDYVEHITDSG